MRRLALGVMLGVVVTWAATAAAHDLTARPPICRRSSTGYVCRLPHIARGSFGAYTVNDRDLDLSCLLIRSGGLSFGCDRLSKPFNKCVDGTLSSVSVFINLARMELDTPQRCVPKPGHHPPYKLTSGYEKRVFYRSP